MGEFVNKMEYLLSLRSSDSSDSVKRPAHCELTLFLNKKSA